MARKTEDTGKFSWKQFATYVSTVSILVLFVGLLVALALGARPLEARATTILNTGPTQVRFAWPPIAGGGAQGATWLPVADQESLITLANNTLGTKPDPLSSSSLESLVSALTNSGWFVGAPTATRGRGNVITITGYWRIPAAVVRQSGKDYLVSWDALPMPAVYTSGESNMRFIEDPGVAVPRTAGGTVDYTNPWPGEGLSASLELLELVVRQPWAGQVAGIDASQFSASGQLALVTTDRNKVVWGGRPSKTLLGEVSTNAKLKHISQMMQDFGRVDAGYPLIYVNSDKIQFDISASAKSQGGPDAQVIPGQVPAQQPVQTPGATQPR